MLKQSSSYAEIQSVLIVDSSSITLSKDAARESLARDEDGIQIFQKRPSKLTSPNDIAQRRNRSIKIPPRVSEIAEANKVAVNQNLNMNLNLTDSEPQTA